MSRVKLYVNDRLVAEETGDSVHLLVSSMCDLAVQHGQPHVVVNPDRSVLSVYVDEEDIRNDSGFALEVDQLAQLAAAGIPMTVGFVVDD